MHTVEDKRIVLFGGTGFVGRELANRLIRAGAYVTIVARHPERGREVTVLPRVRLRRGDVRDPTFVGRVLAGQDAAVNLVGILGGSPRLMRALHVDWPARLAESGAGLARLVHVGAVNADPDGPSRYLATKGEGEARIRAARAPWTIVAPSVVFGPGDGVFARFARLLRLAPLVALVIKPGARFAPVYAGDVAQAIVRILADPTLAGQRLALGGPDIWTMRQIYAYILRQTGLKRVIVPVPDLFARLLAIVSGLAPTQPFSLDQFRTLGVDAVADASALRRLGIEPTPVDAIVPTYIGPARRQELLDRFRRDSGGAPTASA